jgi:hypothetical protein
MQRNLYMTEVALYDRPALEVVTFTTHFGKFGLMTCFDALFQHPFIDLIETEGIITHLGLKNLVLKKNTLHAAKLGLCVVPDVLSSYIYLNYATYMQGFHSWFMVYCLWLILVDEHVGRIYADSEYNKMLLI